LGKDMMDHTRARVRTRQIRISGWRQAARYEVRPITKAVRANHRLPFASVVAGPPLEEGFPPQRAGSAVTEPAPDVDASLRRDGFL
jgi:hypothetical protein